ncbi:glycine cleavage system protein T [Sulfolobales archaeon HS-7]|nr:glycine cleavage system protein T [Sulfolobales archaeon HS-7]
MNTTPLIEFEEKLGASTGEFAGWTMPMSYRGYKEEHMAVRNNVALFDISHMGRIIIEGKEEELQYLLAGLVGESSLRMYGPNAFLNDKATFLDDVMVYKLAENRWLIVTNAVNREKVIDWIRRNSSLNVTDATFDYCMLALQGPNSTRLIGNDEMSRLQFKVNVKVFGENVFILSRSGWTGEDGFELILKPDAAHQVMSKMVHEKVELAGLIARDSLRQEMGFVLYGEDIDESTNPVEARYWLYSLEKEFIGREAILSILTSGVSRIRVGFKFERNEKIVPKKDGSITVRDKKIGKITSATYSPFLSRPIGMGYINSTHALFGLKVEHEHRGKKYEVKISDFPLIK